MKILKSKMQDYLNSFWGEYREIFFEKSKWFNLSCVNWNFKTPSFSNLEWFSVLSRTWKNEYFKVFSYLENIDESIKEFSKEFWLDSNFEKIDLKGEEFLEFKNDDYYNLNPEKLIEYAKKSYEEIIKTTEFIKSSEISIILSKKSFIVWNTQANFATDNLFYTTFFIKLVGQRNWVYEEVYEKIAWTDIFDDINYEMISWKLTHVINVLDKQLDAEKSPDWKIDVIIWNESGWTIIHEAVWHWLEADLQNSSVYKDKIGQKVASELVTVIDHPNHLAKQRGCYNIDHEGNISQKAVLIENWILKWYLHTHKTSLKFNTETTSHARRENYACKTLVRMGNTFLAPWKDKKEDLIKKVNYWLYVSRMWWWQVNTTTWDFVFKVQNWFLIENWVLTKPVRWATLSWNWPQMLNEIYWICDDLEIFDGWTCWKWQSMPVTDWTPTILTKLKVSSL